MASREIFRCVYGSRLFGTATPDSDEDFRSVVLPDRESVLLGRAREIRQTESRARANVAGDIDRTELSVQAFLDLIRKSEVTAIETLFAPSLISTPEWDGIYAHRHALVSSNVQKFVGFSKGQVMRYGGRGQDVSLARAVLEILDRIPGNQVAVSSRDDVMEDLGRLSEAHEGLVLRMDPEHPTVPLLTLNGRTAQLTQNAKDVRIVFQGFLDRAGKRSLAAADRPDKGDLKGLYHAVRILLQAEEILNTGELVFPLACAPLLLRIRAGEFSTERCIVMCDEITDRINAAAEGTVLAAKPDEDVIKGLILDLHGQIVEQRTELGMEVSQ